MIGLGNRCECKEFINGYFNKKEGLDNFPRKKEGHSDLFDWLFINNYEFLSKSLDNKLIDLFEKDELKITNPLSTFVVSEKYSMIWNHLFDSASNNHWVRAHGGELTQERWDNAFPFISKKINYLKEKFINAKEKKHCML